MWNSIQIDEFPKVGIYRDQDSAIGLCSLLQRTVPRIWTQVTCFEGIVPVVAEPLRQTATSTPVYEKSHNCFTETAASVSPAITACA